MNNFQKFSLVITRMIFGWFFFYAGITKVLNPSWSAAKFLGAAKSFPVFYHWLASDSILPIVNFLNEWGLTLLGVSLILGALVRVSIPLGILLMVLYYFPLGFPRPDANSLVVDEHIIFIVGLLLLIAFRAGDYLGLDRFIKRR